MVDEGASGAEIVTSPSVGSARENRTCGAPHSEQKGALSETGEPQRWQACSTLLTNYLIASCGSAAREVAIGEKPVSQEKEVTANQKRDGQDARPSEVKYPAATTKG
jgi:hypothetical protein